MAERRWVIAFDKVTGERVAFTVCDLNNAKMYEAKYQISGYDAKIMTEEESLKLAEEEKKQGKLF